MLRLLPERLYAGLLGQHAWLAFGTTGKPLPLTASVPAGATPSELLEACLQSAPPRRGTRKLSVMLPSMSARCVCLPWSAAIHGTEEKQAYAWAHLEQAGLNVDGTYVVHADFRHYGATGLAYAFPKQLLDELHAVAARHFLDLTTVLPIVGIAHLAAGRASGAGGELSLVIEDNVITALRMNCTGLQRYDAEPTIGGHRAALRRLLTRLAADGTEIKKIKLCADLEDVELDGIAGAFAPQVSMQRLKSPQWRRYI